MEIRGTEGQFRDSSITLPDDKNLIVLVGGNNSGKTTVLREIRRLNPERYRHVSVHRTTVQGEGAGTAGPPGAAMMTVPETDNQPVQPAIIQDFKQLDDDVKQQVLDWYKTYFPFALYTERANPKNTESELLLKVGKHSITKQGTGIRMTFEIFIRLFDDNIPVLCIDEPEMGLEPTLQKFLFQAIKDKTKEGKKVIIATHSHHFLDLENVENNYICQRDSDDKIFLKEVTDIKEVIYRLLGNSLTSLLLPEKIIVLEGPSDVTYIEKLLKLYGKENYALHNSTSISKVGSSTEAITQFLKFTDSDKSVYKSSTYIIVDRPEKEAVVKGWERLVDNVDAQICKLSENGIEYYYPERILQKIFDTTDSKEEILKQYLKYGHINLKYLSKPQLSALVADMLEDDDLKEENELFKYVSSLP